MSSVIPDSVTRKALEKVYARIFDVANAPRGRAPELTADGKLLLQQAKVEADDIMVKTLQDFQNNPQATKGSPQRNKVAPPSPSIFKGMKALPDDSKKTVKDPETVKREQDEVAKIRFEHHQIKRIRKLQTLSKLADQLAAKKKQEKERAERDYYNKINNSVMAVNKTIDDYYGSPSSRNKYKDKVDRMLMTTQTPPINAKRAPGAYKV